MKQFFAVIWQFILSIFKTEEKPVAEVIELKKEESLVIIPHIPQKGEKSEVVKILQRALNAKGFKLDEDGWLWTETEKAISDFQKSIGLVGTGKLGDKTLEALGLKFSPTQVMAKPEPSIGLTAALSWELPCNDGQVNQSAKPERKAWSEHLFNELNKNYDVLMSASDIKELIPNFDTRTRSERLTALAELMSTVAEYESSWNPKSYSKDVNGSSEPGLMARGLFQMNSDADQKNYRTGTNYKHEDLHNPLINIELGVKILVTVIKVRGKITFRKEEKSSVLRYFYATLLINGAVGGKVLASAQKRIASALGAKEEKPSQDSTRKTPLWFLEAKKYSGKKETEPEFNKMMSKKWSLFGMNLGTISESWAAWCGLAAAVALAGAGYDYQKNGSLAKNWASYGQAIEWKTDGIPQGAIVQINHTKCGNGSSNHVSMAEGDCTAQDLLKSGATIDLYGGNQGNTWKISTYSVKEICAVRWPKEESKPPKVTVSRNCTSKKASAESTR